MLQISQDLKRCGGLAHWCGDHNNCTDHAPEWKSKYQPLSNASTIAWLRSLMVEFVDEAPQFVHSFNTCLVESFNYLITEYSAKGAGEAVMHTTGVACAILHCNEGVKFRTSIFDLILHCSKNPKLVQQFQVIEDEEVTEEDIPKPKPSNSGSADPSDADVKDNGYSGRKKPHCQVCKVPMKGHKCPHRAK